MPSCIMSIAQIKLFNKSIDTEMQQALIRLAFLIWGLTFFSIGLYNGFYPIASKTFYIYGTIFTAYTFIMIVSINIWPNIKWRIYFAAIFDIIFISLGILFTGDSTSPFFFLYIWVLIGQAIRYGQDVLFTAAATAIVCYIAILIISPDIKDNPLETTFFLMTLIIMPLYLHKLIKLLHQSRIEADTANKAKSIFIANMSHELRTPLNAIIGYSEMMKEDADKLGYETYSKDLSKIKNAGLHLLSLINNILDFSKIEAGKTQLDYSNVDIIKLISSVSDTINPLTKNQNNNFIVTCPDDIGEFFSDKIKLTQTLVNLLSNANKFTENGIFELIIYRDRKDDDDWIYFIVKDTGIGIANDKFKLLFKPFSQATASTTRLYGGTGLGLTISKRFIDLMNGTINVESTPGEGTTFTIKLPALRYAPRLSH